MLVGSSVQGKAREMYSRERLPQSDEEGKEE